MRSSVLLFTLGISALIAGCSCGAEHLVKTEEPPPSSDSGTAAPADPPPPANDLCPAAVGAVTGRVCAPDQKTWLNGAHILVQINCHGTPKTIETTSAADGTFKLESVPEGKQTVVAELGSFRNTYDVTVTANATIAIPDDQLCFRKDELKLAVLTGGGDKIETLLTSLNLSFTTFGAATAAEFAAQGEPFLSDLSKMKAFDVIFIDCAAARANGNIDLGRNSAAIVSNLKAFVQQGGSLYASDWAFVFLDLSWAAQFDFLLRTGGPVTSPFDPRNLMGYAPQIVSAKIEDPALATFLGKAAVQVAFPKETGASSLHWGLMQDARNGARILLSADVQSCETKDNLCSTPGLKLRAVPLAVAYKATPAGQKGGNVVYTSFHNIAQPTGEVAQILKYLVFNL